MLLVNHGNLENKNKSVERKAFVDSVYGQDFHFYHKTKHKAVDKTLEQCCLKEFKATRKNSGEAELKQ